MRHATAMKAEGSYVDSHGQSEIGFGLTRLLGYDLLPGIKQINKVKLYRPGREDEDTYDNLADAMTRPIRWDVIENNYDQLIKYATAIRVGTASTEAILRRFTRAASHSIYHAMLEVGKAQKTIFVSSATCETATSSARSRRAPTSSRARTAPTTSACRATAVEAAQNVSADLCLIGVTGVQPDAGLTTGDAQEAAMKRALAARAAETYILASSEKIGTASRFRVLPWEKISALITDADPHDTIVEQLTALGVEVLAAD